MNSTILREVRHEIYTCFSRAADALFNTVDALVTETQAHAFPELSLSPFFERRWSSLYEAFEDGRIDHERLRGVFAMYSPLPLVGTRVWWGIDASSIQRPESPTARDRSVVYVPNMPGSKKPISFGWQFSTVVVLPEQPSSWTYTLDQQRISTQQTSTQVAASQLHQLLPLVPYRPIVTTDRWYSCQNFVRDTQELACDKLLRVKRNRVFYRPAPVPTGKRGAPRKDGERFQCSDPSTHGAFDEQWQGTDEHGQSIEVTRWNHLHLRNVRHVDLALLRVLRSGATQSLRDPKESWFLWTGQDALPLSEVVPGYKRRYSMEHGYRFDKQALLWSKPHLRTPEQFERWTDVVAIAHNLLVLARPFVQAEYRGWESKHRTTTPQQVRRGIRRILAQLGTPAKAPQRRGKSPGRAQGTVFTPAPRFSVVRKPKKPRKTVPLTV